WLTASLVLFSASPRLAAAARGVAAAAAVGAGESRISWLRAGGAACQRCCPASSSARAFWMPCSRTSSASCRSARARERGTGAARRQRAEAFALVAELVGDRGGDQVVLGGEVGVEGAVSQPGVGHERGDPGAVDAVALEPAARRLDDPLPGYLLVFFPVPRHT